jgi:hypothetical protein
MFLIEWYRQWKETKREFSEPKICEGCEVLKVELAHLHQDNQRLLDKILTPPTAPIERTGDNVTPILPRRGVPWNARKQMLEENDRHKAKLMKDAPKPSPVDTTLEELESDVLSAEREREISN